MSGTKSDETGAFPSFAADASTPEKDRALPWDDSDFARISQIVTRSAPPPPTTEEEEEATEEPTSNEAAPIASEESEPAQRTEANAAAPEAVPNPVRAAPLDVPVASPVDSQAEATRPARDILSLEKPLPAEATMPAFEEVSSVRAAETDDAPTAAAEVRREEPTSAVAASPVRMAPESSGPGERFPRLIRLKGAQSVAERVIPQKFSTSYDAEERAEPRFARSERAEPTFEAEQARAFDADAGSSDTDEWDRIPPRFERDEEEEEFRGFVPEPMVSDIVGGEAWREERGFPLRWIVVAVIALGFGYGAFEALQPLSPSGGERPQVASLQPPASVPAAPASAAAVAQAPAESPIVPGPKTAPPAKREVAAAKPAPTTPPASARPAPREEKIAKLEEAQRPPLKREIDEPPSVQVPSRPTVQTNEAPSAPVTLAPGPRNLAASVPLPASAEATASGDLVMEAQLRLAALGYGPGPANGYLTPTTRDALLRFQHDAGLPQTGEIDSRTWAKLDDTQPSEMRLVRGPAPVAP